MAANYIDAHCHLADPRLAPVLEKVLARAEAAAIRAYIQGGVDPADWDRQLELARRYPGRIFCCFGLHPWFVAGGSSDEGLRRAMELLPRYLGQAVGLGELGLDHGPRVSPASHERQKKAFQEQLGIARDRPMPLVLHVVRAHGEALGTLERFAPFPRGGIVHSFNGSREVAERYLKLGFSLSIGPAITREKGHETLKRAVATLPLDRLVLETDSPDQPPEGWSAANEPLNEPKTLWTVARAASKFRKERGISPETLLERSRENVVRIFGLELRTGNN